jgi:hypothetical protein
MRTRSHLNRSRSRIAVLMAIAVMLLLAIPVQAAPAIRSSNTLFDAATGDPVIGSASSLVRTDNGLSMNIRTSGLPAGHTYTVWWIIFNDPDSCEHGIEGVVQCGEGDLLLFGGSAAGVVGHATGNVVGGNGKSSFGAHLKVGDTDGFIDAFVGHNGLTNPRGAEVHLVLRDHGPKIPEFMPDQIHTFAGGCDQSELPPPLQLGVAGDFDCIDTQFTFHVID